ncbi:hypothetical protein Gorai_021103 [Gossypium raimondii]|uniref:Uncharacterized protein n=1 Tax=Gossypium raimondii TaxID=29730 RepID=A0A7J8NPB3_GOSRA|nr:hypothetical protein [Gossypium raimondii]
MMNVNQLPRETSGVSKYIEEERYDPWMLVERRQKKGVKLVLAKIGRATAVGERNGSRFESLSGDLGLAKRQVAGKLKARNKIRGKSANKEKLILIEDGPKVGRKIGWGNHVALTCPSSKGKQSIGDSGKKIIVLNWKFEWEKALATVMNESIHGMCSHDRENSRLMDDEVEDDDSSDQSLADAEEA